VGIRRRGLGSGAARGAARGVALGAPNRRPSPSRCRCPSPRRARGGRAGSGSARCGIALAGRWGGRYATCAAHCLGDRGERRVIGIHETFEYGQEQNATAVRVCAPAWLQRSQYVCTESCTGLHARRTFPKQMPDDGPSIIQVFFSVHIMLTHWFIALQAGYYIPPIGTFDFFEFEDTRILQVDLLP
jgi:hypothetical protein